MIALLTALVCLLIILISDNVIRTVSSLPVNGEEKKLKQFEQKIREIHKTLREVRRDATRQDLIYKK
jgi:hypothetical protein